METIEKLKLKIGTEVTDEVLEMYLSEAESSLLVYLNVDTLEGKFVSTQIELARIYYLRDNGKNDVKSESYTEGVVSQSVTYKTSAEYQEEAKALLKTLAQYRRVYAIKRENT